MSAAAPTVSEADVILPPPSALNPIPSLSAALRLDNQEQLLDLLQSNPEASAAAANFRQLLVFGSSNLRTLLLRQVLQDPHSSRQIKGKHQAKKNWDSYNSFQYPKQIAASIVGTRLLEYQPTTTSSSTATTNPFSVVATSFVDGGAEVSYNNNNSSREDDESQHIDVLTYFIRPWDVAQTQAVARKVRSFKKKVHHRIVYIPQQTALINQVLQDLGLTTAPNVTITSLQLDLFPIETDVYSLEYGAATKDEGVEGTPSTVVTACARALLKLQDITGTIPRIQSIGKLSEQVLDRFLNQSVDEYLADSNREQDEGVPEPLPDGNIAMVFIDRKVDMVTPMVTPLTYEGLLDEVVGIDCGFIQVDVNTINPEDEQEDERKSSSNPFDSSPPKREIVSLGVNAGDSLYAEVRDQHVEKFGSFLQNQAMALRESHANFTNKGNKKDLQEIHQFVKQIPMFTQNLRSLTNHIHLAELIKAESEQVSFREQWQTERSMIEGELCNDILEEWICSRYPPWKVLRLLCLQSLCAGGFKSNRYDSFRSLVVQSYGYEFLLILHDLEKIGLIRRKEALWMDSASASFASLRRSLILINAEVDTVEPDDVSYVSSGYAPLTVRLVQSAVQGWTNKNDIIEQLPGRLLDIQQCHPPQDLSATLKMQNPPVTSESLGVYAKSAMANDSTKPTLVVVFLGGITFMEIAALRFLSKRPTFPFHIIIITTKVINGSTLLQSLGG